MDTYGTAETARLLGVSPKRVRQMVAAGQLTPVTPEHPYRFEQETVHRLRETRKADPRTKTATKVVDESASTAPEPPSASIIEGLIAQLMEQTAQAARYQITAEVNERLQAERDALAAQVAQLTERLNRRRWGRKG